MIEDSGLFEARLVLRTVFQPRDQRWVQTGAGVIEPLKAQGASGDMREVVYNRAV